MRSITHGSAMDNRSPSELGELERAVLLHVWRLGSASAEQVRAALSRPLKESTVRTVLRRLEEKGHLVHSVQGRTFIYRAAQSRGQVAANAVKRIADWFCGGSLEEVVAGLVEARMIEEKELLRLTEKITKARRSARK